jgi:Glycosyl hydrolase family 26
VPSSPQRTIHRPRLLVSAIVTLLLALIAALTGHAAQAAVPRAAPLTAPKVAEPPANAVLSGLDDHWESDIVTDDAQNGAKSGIVGTFLNWSTTKASSIVNYGKWANGRSAVPMIDLYPPTTVTDASIAAGSQDTALIAEAKALHTWNHVFLFRLFPEMNGRWESYSPGTRHQTARQFVRAWRHVYRLFRSHHASKVMFVWNPDKELSSQYTSFRHLWPGKGYVNWIGLDVFNEQDATHGRFPSPRTALAPSVHAIRRFSGKPLMIPEIGVANYSGKPGWIRTALGKMSRLGFKAVVWYNEASAYANGTPVNWRLDSSSAALRATRHTLAGKAVVWPGHNGGRLARDEKMILHGHW